MNTVPSNKNKNHSRKEGFGESVDTTQWRWRGEGGGGVLWMIDAMMTINQGVSRVLGPSDRRWLAEPQIERGDPRDTHPAPQHAVSH